MTVALGVARNGGTVVDVPDLVSGRRADGGGQREGWEGRMGGRVWTKAAAAVLICQRPGQQ